MAILDSLNFEDVDIDTLCTAYSWVKNNSPILSTTRKYSGSQSLYCGDTVGYRFWGIRSNTKNKQSFYMRFMLNVEELPPVASQDVIIMDTMYGEPIEIRITSTGTMQLVTNGTIRATTTLTASLNTWYELFIYATASTTTSLELKVFGETLSYSGAALNDSYINNVWIGTGGIGDVTKYYVDEFELNDSEYPPSLLGVNKYRKLSLGGRVKLSKVRI